MAPKRNVVSAKGEVASLTPDPIVVATAAAAAAGQLLPRAMNEEGEAPRFINPRDLSEGDRLELIAQARAGELLELPFRAVVYWDEPNANHWRFDPDLLLQVIADADAAHASGLPVQTLLDHGDRGMCSPPSVKTRVGDWQRFHLVTRPEDGVRGIVGEGVLTDPRVQEDYLRGKLDRFSVGAGRVESTRCSGCNVVRAGYRRASCEDCHGPGSFHAQTGELVEAFANAPLEEVSFVAFPAVDRTGLLSSSTPSPTPAAMAIRAPTPPTAGATTMSRGPNLNGGPSQLERAVDAVASAVKGDTPTPTPDPRVAELEAQLAASEQEKTAMATALFESIVDQGVAAGKVNRADEKELLVLFDALGGDGLRAYIDRQAVNPAHSAADLGGGTSGAGTRAPASQAQGPDRYAMCRLYARRGRITSAQLSNYIATQEERRKLGLC